MATRRHFSREFKVEAVKLATERGVATMQAARDLGVHETMIRAWVKERLARTRSKRFPARA